MDLDETRRQKRGFLNLQNNRFVIIIKFRLQQ
jgi:hypothetical protein